MHCRRLLLSTTTALPITTAPEIGGGSPSLTAATAAANEGGGGLTAAPASAPNAGSAAPTLPRLQRHRLANDDQAGKRGRQLQVGGGGGRLAALVDGSG